MARTRKNSDLPANLNRNGAGYFYYRYPAGADAPVPNFGLGRDEQEARRVAEEINATLLIKREELRQARTETMKLRAKSGFTLDEDGMLNIQFLRQNAERYDRVSGVYFLIFDGEVVYVGQSLDCHTRLATHFREDAKTFDSSYIVRSTPHDLNDLEALYIKKFKPKFNAAMPQARRKAAWGLKQEFAVIEAKL